MMVIFYKTVKFTGNRLFPGNCECSGVEKQTCNITLTIMYLREMMANEITDLFHKKKNTSNVQYL